VSGENDWTFWLNVTNAALGLVVLGAILIVCFAMFREFLRAKAPQPQTASGIDQELAAMMREESHRMLVPELGLTMADGGEKREASNSQSSAEK
jgi:hypothetical protein